MGAQRDTTTRELFFYSEARAPFGSQGESGFKMGRTDSPNQSEALRISISNPHVVTRGTSISHTVIQILAYAYSTVGARLGLGVNRCSFFRGHAARVFLVSE